MPRLVAFLSLSRASHAFALGARVSVWRGATPRGRERIDAARLQLADWERMVALRQAGRDHAASPRANCSASADTLAAVTNHLPPLFTPDSCPMSIARHACCQLIPSW
jgi:hypothetical protein